MRFVARKKISELEALTTATLDTTFVVGISGSTTYKISINQLTSSLDTAFATDLVTNALSNSIDTKLSISSFNSYSSSFDNRINIVSSSVSTGTSGTSGTSGPQGNQGSIGPQGVNGTAGSSGVQGPQGNQGSIGPQGVEGAQGNQGEIGVQGPQGEVGTQGDNGTSGTDGTSGTNGVQGTQGPQGNQGTIGPQGVNGTAGSSGVQGSQGNQGPQGNQGAQGTTLNINQYSGSVSITGSLLVSSMVTVSSSIVANTSSLYLTTGSNLYVQNDGLVEITGSLIATSITGSIASTNGVISGSSQLTSSFDGRYTQTGSFNELSSSVDSRLDTLEVTIISGSPNYTQILGNRRTSISSVGTSIISGSITTTGNPVQITITGDANPIGGVAYGRIQIFRDNNAIGAIVQVENSANLNVPYCLNVIDTPSAGTYVYSMRLVDSMSGTFDFGEVTGPLLTAVELKTNTNLPSTNNTFTGTNTFNNSVTLGGAIGDEGGELKLAYAQTNNTLTGSNVSVDVFQSKVRIFEGGGNSRGVSIDLSKAPANAGGELTWKASAMVAVGTFVTLDNLKCTVTASGNRGLSIAAVSTSFEADISGVYSVPGATGGGSTNNITYTTTASTSAFGWNFAAHGDTAIYQMRDKTNNRFYRITLMIGVSYISNFISIERLF